MKERKTRLHESKREREENDSKLIILFGVWNELCELTIYRENSQLICEKL